MSAPAALLVNALWQGGAERVVLTIAAELLRRGRPIELVCLEEKSSYELPPGLVRHVLSREGGGRGPAKLLALPLLARRLAALSRKRGYRVIQSHLFRANYVNVLSASFGARHEVQAVNHTKPERLLAEGLQGGINAALTRALYPRADRLVAISARMARDLAAFLGLEEGLILTINNPYELGRMRELAELSAPAGLGLEAGKRRIFAMGRLVPLKRFDELLAAFARVAPGRPELELVLLGEGPERAALEARARELGLDGRVSLPGFLANPYPLLKGSAAFVLSSETEGFPNALVEALALGVPVLSADCVSGPREILAPESDWRLRLDPGAGLEEAPYGLLCPVGDPAALARGLERLLDEAALSKRYAAAGPGRAADFGASRIVDRYETLLFPEAS